MIRRPMAWCADSPNVRSAAGFQASTRSSAVTVMMASPAEAIMAFDRGEIELQSWIKLRLRLLARRATAAATVSWVIGEWLSKGKPSMLGGASGAVGVNLLDLPDPADDPPAGHHLITLLELGQQLRMAFAGLSRGTEDEEIEHQTDGRHLQDQDGQSAAGTGL